MNFIVANNKGGTGKTITTTNLAALLHAQGRNFKVIELDSVNKSFILPNSDFLTPERAVSITINKADAAINDMLFDLMSDDSLDFIIDVGGGPDTASVLDLILPLDLQKTYIIPLLKIKMYIENALTTYEQINDPQNTVFLLNQYTNLENIKSEFKYFFGDKYMGIEPVSPIFKTAKTIYMPFSELFQIASDDSQTILDLASVSRGVSELEARKMAFELSKGDRAKFAALRTQYNNSLDAQKIFDEMIVSTRALFE